MLSDPLLFHLLATIDVNPDVPFSLDNREFVVRKITGVIDPAEGLVHDGYEIAPRSGDVAFEDINKGKCSAYLVCTGTGESNEVFVTMPALPWTHRHDQSLDENGNDRQFTKVMKANKNFCDKNETSRQVMINSFADDDDALALYFLLRFTVSLSNKFYSPNNAVEREGVIKLKAVLYHGEPLTFTSPSGAQPSVMTRFKSAIYWKVSIHQDPWPVAKKKAIAIVSEGEEALREALGGMQLSN